MPNCCIACAVAPLNSPNSKAAAPERPLLVFSHVSIQIHEKRIEVARGYEAHFEGVQEFRVPMGPSATKSGPDVLLGATVNCHRGLRNAADCPDCDHFINYVPSDDGETVKIRCLWSDEDTVAELMTAEAAVVTVTPGTFICEADELAQTSNVHHLLVVDNGVLVGLLCRCDLLPPVKAGDKVSHHMCSKVWLTSPRARLSDVAVIMAEQKIDCLPVVDGEQLLGIITSRDLDRAGVGHGIDEVEGT